MGTKESPSRTPVGVKASADHYAQGTPLNEAQAQAQKITPFSLRPAKPLTTATSGDHFAFVVSAVVGCPPKT